MLRRHGTRLGAALLAVLLASVLYGCAPGGAAVGDTRDRSNAVTHDSIDTGDIMIGFVGSAHRASDVALLDAINAAGLKAAYCPTTTGETHSGGIGSVVDQCVRDFAVRAVNIIVTNSIDAAAHGGRDWNQALATARGDGIPVVLVDPVSRPGNPLLYAAVLVSRSGSSRGDAVPLSTALLAVVNDNPHARSMTVSFATR